MSIPIHNRIDELQLELHGLPGSSLMSDSTLALQLRTELLADLDRLFSEFDDDYIHSSEIRIDLGHFPISENQASGIDWTALKSSLHAQLREQLQRERQRINLQSSYNYAEISQRQYTSSTTTSAGHADSESVVPKACTNNQFKDKTQQAQPHIPFWTKYASLVRAVSDSQSGHTETAPRETPQFEYLISLLVRSLQQPGINVAAFETLLQSLLHATASVNPSLAQQMRVRLQQAGISVGAFDGTFSECGANSTDIITNTAKQSPLPVHSNFNDSTHHSTHHSAGSIQTQDPKSYEPGSEYSTNTDGSAEIAASNQHQELSTSIATPTNAAASRSGHAIAVSDESNDFKPDDQARRSATAQPAETAIEQQDADQFNTPTESRSINLLTGDGKAQTGTDVESGSSGTPSGNAGRLLEAKQGQNAHGQVPGQAPDIQTKPSTDANAVDYFSTIAHFELIATYSGTASQPDSMPEISDNYSDSSRDPVENALAIPAGSNNDAVTDPAKPGDLHTTARSEKLFATTAVNEQTHSNTAIARLLLQCALPESADIMRTALLRSLNSSSDPTGFASTTLTALIHDTHITASDGLTGNSIEIISALADASQLLTNLASQRTAAQDIHRVADELANAFSQSTDANPAMWHSILQKRIANSIAIHPARVLRLLIQIDPGTLITELSRDQSSQLQLARFPSTSLDRLTKHLSTSWHGSHGQVLRRLRSVLAEPLHQAIHRCVLQSVLSNPLVSASAMRKTIRTLFQAITDDAIERASYARAAYQSLNGETGDDIPLILSTLAEIDQATSMHEDTSMPVANAGIVLLWPYLVTLFERSDLVRDNNFVDDQARNQAANLLAYTVYGNDAVDSLPGPLERWLTAIPEGQQLFQLSKPSEASTTLIEGLLKMVCERWPPLANTSIDGLRESFLQRPGILQREPKAELTIEQKTLDILLDKLPWSISTVRLPWRDDVLTVHWR